MIQQAYMVCKISCAHTLCLYFVVWNWLA